MMRHPEQRAHPGGDLVGVPPLHVRQKHVIAMGPGSIRNRIQASDGEQRDSNQRFVAKLFGLAEKVLKEERDERGHAEAAPESAGAETRLGAKAKQPQRQCAHYIPIIEVAKNRRLLQSVKGIAGRNSGSRGCFHKTHPQRMIKARVIDIQTMADLQIGQRELHHQEPGQHHAQPYPGAAPDAGEDRSRTRELAQQRSHGYQGQQKKERKRDLVGGDPGQQDRENRSGGEGECQAEKKLFGRRAATHAECIAGHTQKIARRKQKQRESQGRKRSLYQVGGRKILH